MLPAFSDHASPMHAYFGDFWLVRSLFQRGLAAIYFVAFLSSLDQFPALLGERGLLPVRDFVSRIGFREAPSLFQFHYSDRFFRVVAGLGIALSCVLFSGLSDAGPTWLSMAIWFVLWALYLSIVNVGQIFYAFGWESMLLEAGFFAVFLGPSRVAPSLIPVLALRWMLFRVELGAGLIKLRHDPCWRDLTCLYFHYETQPMPNPLSSYFHHLPKWCLRQSVLFSHFVQVVAPFGLFAPQPVASVAAALIVLQQLVLIVSGNYSWLNWLTVVLGLTGLSDRALGWLPILHAAPFAPRSLAFDIVLYVLGGVTLLLSIQPTLNFFSKRQLMNYSFNPLHLVGCYGAFGSITRTRYEIVVEGSESRAPRTEHDWHAYEFKGKPGDPKRRPRQWAPYHLRLDWLLWFLPLSVDVVDGRPLVLQRELWFRRFVQKLLEADAATLRLLRKDPFEGRAPKFVRASFYRYRLTTARERKRTGCWWKRTRLGDYLRAVTLPREEMLRRDAAE